MTTGKKFCANCGAALETSNTYRPTQKSHASYNSKLTIGIIILVIGIALIVITQTVSLTIRHDTGYSMQGIGEIYRNDDTLENVILFLGIASLIAGGIVLAFGFQEKRK